MPEVQSEAQRINAYWADKLMAWSSKKKEQVIPVAMALQKSGFAAEEARTRCIIAHSVFAIIASRSQDLVDANPEQFSARPTAEPNMAFLRRYVKAVTASATACPEPQLPTKGLVHIAPLFACSYVV